MATLEYGLKNDATPEYIMGVLGEGSVQRKAIARPEILGTVVGSLEKRDKYCL